MFMRLYLLLQDRLLFLQRDAVIVLDRDHDGVNSLGDHGSVLLVIMYCHLWDRAEVNSWYTTVEFVIISHLILSSHLSDFLLL